MGDACMDAGGTTPRMESVESSLEQRPRATQDAKAEGWDGGESVKHHVASYVDLAMTKKRDIILRQLTTNN